MQYTSEIQAQYSEISSQIDTYLKQAKDYRNVWEIRSYVNESFYEWNHRVVFDTVSKQLVNLPLKSDNEFYIWKIRKLVRWVKNMITKNDPRWHPRSSRSQKISDDEIKVASSILQELYKEEHIKDKIKDLLTHSLTKTIWWAYVWYCDKKDDIDIYIEDPFNIYTAPDWRLEWPVFVWKYMIRTIRKSLTDIKNSDIYKNWPFKDDLKNISAEMKQAESDKKDMILSQSFTVPVDENWWAIVKELYIMERVKNAKSKKLEDNLSSEEDALTQDQEIGEDKIRVRLITKVWDIIIRDELTEFEQFPFIAYQPERNKWLLYFQSWIEPLISLNKALNDWYSNRADWLDKFAKGRYIVQKWSKFSIIKWRNWQVVEYTWSRPVVQETWSLPNEVNIHMNETERYMEDIWGIHSESTWRLSGWAISWVAIAQLQASDNNNVSEPVDNLKTFMEEMAYRILDLASRFYNLRQIQIEGWEEKSIVGEQVANSSEQMADSKLAEWIIRIKPIRAIEVEIVPWSAFSDLQARQDLVELRWLWVAIPDSLIIDTYKLWNTAQIIQDYQDQEEAKQQQTDSVEWQETSQADLENKKMLEWAIIVPQDSEDHNIHLAVHSQLLEGLWKNIQQHQNLIDHIMSHEQMLPENKRIQPEQQKTPNQ